jgi:hypothetical protein
MLNHLVSDIVLPTTAGGIAPLDLGDIICQLLGFCA